MDELAHEVAPTKAQEQQRTPREGIKKLMKALAWGPHLKHSVESAIAG